MGPPGTGKTDVAVQIISNIYHNFPDQRTLIVTHSNQVHDKLYVLHKKPTDDNHYCCDYINSVLFSLCSQYTFNFVIRS